MHFGVNRHEVVTLSSTISVQRNNTSFRVPKRALSLSLSHLHYKATTRLFFPCCSLHSTMKRVLDSMYLLRWGLAIMNCSDFPSQHAPLYKNIISGLSFEVGKTAWIRTSSVVMRCRPDRLNLLITCASWRRSVFVATRRMGTWGTKCRNSLIHWQHH